MVEDSAIGLAAAKAAGMKCIVTKSGYISIYEMESSSMFLFIGRDDSKLVVMLVIGIEFGISY